MIEVSTQKQLDKALADDANAEVTLIKGSFSLTLSGTAAPLLIVLAAATIDLSARESSQPRVVAWGSSQPHRLSLGQSIAYGEDAFGAVIDTYQLGHNSVIEYLRGGE